MRTIKIFESHVKYFLIYFKVFVKTVNNVAGYIIRVLENLDGTKTVLEGIQPIKSRSQSIKYFEPNLQKYYTKKG